MSEKITNFIFALVMGWPGVGIIGKINQSQRGGYFMRIRTNDIWDDFDSVKFFSSLIY